MDERLGYNLEVVAELLSEANHRRAQSRISRWTDKDWDDNWDEIDNSPHYTDYENTDWEHEDDNDDSEAEGQVDAFVDDGTSNGDESGERSTGEYEAETRQNDVDGAHVARQPDETSDHIGVEVQQNVTVRPVPQLQGIRVVTEEELFRVHASQKPINDEYFGSSFIFFDLKVGDISMGRIIIRLSRFNRELEKHFTRLCQEKTYWPEYLLQSLECSSIYKKSDRFLEGGVMLPLNTLLAEPIYEAQPVVNSTYYDKYTMIANENINDNYGGSRFIITTKKLLHYDPRHIPVGVVIKGRHIIDQMTLLPCENNQHFLFKVWVESCGTLTRHDLIRGGTFERSREFDNFVRFGAHLRKRVRKLSSEESDVESVESDVEDEEAQERARPTRRVMRRRRRHSGNRPATSSP